MTLKTILEERKSAGLKQFQSVFIDTKSRKKIIKFQNIDQIKETTRNLGTKIFFNSNFFLHNFEC